MEETVFFESGPVKVTNARFIVGPQTFAMKNITSVRSDEEEPNRGIAVLLGLVTLVLFLASQWLWGIGGLVFTVWAWRQAKPKYHVALHSAGGETKALSSLERTYIEKVVAALNQAIVHGGA